ncbi:MAG: helix-turn-helix domain-containing protein [bacterium]
MPRQTKYERDGWNEKLEVIEGWARDGLIDKQIAGKMGISHDTLYRYKKRYPEFSEALKRGKQVVDRQVENALLKRALGYEYEEEKREIAEIDPESGETRLITTEIKKKQVKPDTTAQIFWLKNRKPDVWRDTKDIKHSGDVEIEVIVEDEDEDEE